MQRAHALKFKGKYDEAGKPDRYFPGIPARDLDEADIARLSNAEYADAIGGDKPLYAEVKKAEEKQPEPKPKAEDKKAEAKTPKDSAPDAPTSK